MDNSVPLGVQTFMAKVTTEILNPIIGIIFGAALLYFLWGLMVFILNGGDERKITEGKQHMLWGTIGMTIMVSVFAIIWVVLNTFNVGGNDLPDALPLNNTYSVSN